jgi:hypothetical protein
VCSYRNGSATTEAPFSLACLQCLAVLAWARTWARDARCERVGGVAVPALLSRTRQDRVCPDGVVVVGGVGAAFDGVLEVWRELGRVVLIRAGG